MSRQEIIRYLADKSEEGTLDVVMQEVAAECARRQASLQRLRETLMNIQPALRAETPPDFWNRPR